MSDNSHTPSIPYEKAVKFMDLAQHMADTFSKDPHKKVGCVILDPNTFMVRAAGYNGFPLGVKDTPERWQRGKKEMLCSHAELNGVCSAARHGTPLDGTICVCSLHPCSGCARALIQAGIKTVVTRAPDLEHPRWGIEFGVARELFEEAGVLSVIVEGT